MSILISIFISGYHGKTTDFAKNSSCHRTTIAHFLNSGKWDDSLLSDTLKCSVIEIIYSEAARTGKPVFCIVDDTIASKTKPSSRALHPIEDAYFHQSHLKGKQDYGHQAVAVMLSCNGIVLNYAFVMYNKSISKIDIVQSIAKELPVPPVMSYFLCDCWYVSEKIINTFAQRGFHTIGALKTNRLLYPSGMKKKLSELAAERPTTHKGFDLVTVKKRNYYVYRYEYYAHAIHDKYGDDFDVLFGPAYKGIPLSVVTAIAFSELYGKEIRYCSDRKEEKDHGADKGSFLGSKLKDGDRVVMIEDVTTSGKSMEETVPKVKGAADVEIVGLMVSLDRMEVGKGGIKCALEEVKDLYGFETNAIVTMAEVVKYLYNKEINGEVIIDDTLKAAIDAYYEQYGAK